MDNNEEKKKPRLARIDEEMYHEMLEMTGVRCDECGEKTFKEYLKPVNVEGRTLLHCEECYRDE